MKYAELIRAALDGKPIQNRIIGKITWFDFESTRLAVAHLAGESSSYEYRIKPEPVPDKVYFGITAAPKLITEADFRHWKERSPEVYMHIVKVTVKTDENGKETKIVELVD